LRSKSACSAKQSKRLNKTEGFVKPKEASSAKQSMASWLLLRKSHTGLRARVASLNKSVALARAQLLVGPVWLLLRKSLAALALPRLNCSASCRPRLAFATQKFGSASAA